MARDIADISPAEITRHLKGIDFPVTKDGLVEQARENGADEMVAELLDALPDREYDDMADVMEAYDRLNSEEESYNGEQIDADDLFGDEEDFLYDEDEE
ncbi:MAG TPA: DUF2795 domain-containing protein [Ferrovibrio sp.]|uniref:DUF2795 domain-containing protein n=1 Tax=Ferrovibrio sp. TaxID=1917215 RepID=UPI002ED2F6C6